MSNQRTPHAKLIAKVANNFATSPRRAENMLPSNSRRMYDPYRYNWQQENSSRGMASPIEVPLRDATPSVVPLHFPHESSPPALVDITTQSEESMVSFSKITWDIFAFWLLLMS